MKKMSVLILGMIFLWSCSDKYESVLNDSENEEIGTKSVVNGQFNSISNPTLLSDWENTSRILLSTGSSVTSPWMDNTMTSMPANFTKDIKKEDGWMMLFHTFKELNYNTHLNYIVFYNQLTGFMKVFYYEENNIAQNNNGFVWVVKTANGQKTNLFDLGKFYIDYDSKNDKILLSNVSTNPAGGIKKGWNGFEWQIPYTQDYRNLLITIDAYNEQVSTYNFSGKTESTIEGVIISQSKGSNGIISTLANVAGAPAKKLVSLIASSNWLGAGLANSIRNIPSSSYSELAKSGLGKIFGSTTVTTQDIKLSASGTVQLSGSSTTIGGNSVPPLQFNLYDIMQGNISALSNGGMNNFVLNTQSANSESLSFLGVWGIEEKPTVTISRYTQATTVKPVEVHYQWHRFTDVKAYLPSYKDWTTKVKFNPEIEKYITKKHFSTSFISLDKIDGQVYRQDDDLYSLIPSLLYEDSMIRLREWNTPVPFSFASSFEVSTRTKSPDSQCWIDWGEIKGGKGLAVITVQIEYNYNGQIHTLYQTRSYSLDYIPDTNTHILVPYGIILNEGQPICKFRNGKNVVF